MIILIVDDDRGILELYQDVFHSWGYDCVCSSNGDDAVKQCWLYNFDLVILDVILPGKNGFEVGLDIKKTGLRCPLLYWTGHEVGDKFLKRTQSSNMVLLRKPFPLIELRKTICHLVSSYKDRTTLKPIAELEIVYNGLKRFIPLSDTVSIGRAKNNDIRLLDDRISAYHLMLVRMFEFDKTFYRIIDGQVGGKVSTNGVFVNKIRLGDLDYRDLNHNDEIVIPNVVMIYRLLVSVDDTSDDTYS